DAHGLAHRPQHEIAGEQQEEHDEAGDHRAGFVVLHVERALQPALEARRHAQLNIPISSSCCAAVSSSPWPARSWSAWRSGLPVAGITTVTAGWLMTNFRNICDQDVMPASAAQPGSARPPTRLNSRPSSKARLTITATPWSRAAGSRRDAAAGELTA